MFGQGRKAGFALLAAMLAPVVIIIPAAEGAPQTAQRAADDLRGKDSAAPLLRKKPGRVKYADITLKKGYASSERIAGWRKALRPRKAQKRLHGARIHGRPDPMLRDTQKLDLLLQRLQRSVQTYEKLRARRERAAARGVDTSGLESRLMIQIKDIERQAEAVRRQAQRMSTRFRNSDRKQSQMMNLLSRIMRSMKEMRSVGAATRSGL